MFFSLVLAAAAAASPPPAASSLAPLRVIASVRSTPLCSALRTKVGPAISALLENDATIDQAPPTFDRMYKNMLLNASGGWEQWNARGFINRGNLESLIGPLVKNFKRIDDLLADSKVFVPNPVTADERRLAQIKERLSKVEAQQKAALNIVSGYDATSQAWQILTEDESAGLHVSSPSQWSRNQFNSAGFFSGGNTQTGGISMQGPRSSPGRFDASLAYNPLRPFAQSVIDTRAAGDSAETDAAAVIAPIAASCRAR